MVSLKCVREEGEESYKQTRQVGRKGVWLTLAQVAIDDVVVLARASVSACSTGETQLFTVAIRNLTAGGHCVMAGKVWKRWWGCIHWVYALCMKKVG